MYCYIYAGLLDCAADGTLCGESNETIGVCGEPLMTPHSFFLGHCLRWLPPATVSGGSPQWSLPDLILDPGPFDFGPGSIWFGPGSIWFGPGYDYAFPSAIGQGWPSLSCKFSMQIRPVPFICEDSQVAPHSVSGDSPQRVAVCYTVYRVECYVLSNLIWKFS